MLGSHFADWVLENQPNYEVVGIDNLEGGYIENVHPNVQFYKMSIGDDLTSVFKGRNVEYFFAFGCYSAEGLSPFMRRFNYTNNLVGTANVVNFCIKNKVKLIYASSMSVYGNLQPPFKETDVCKPIDPYGIAKYAGEMDIKVAHDQHGLDYCIIRPHNIIGPRQNIWDKYRNVIGIWMRQIINNEPITIYGDGNQTRAFSWVMDYCPVFWKVAENDYGVNRIFNCGGDKHYTLNEVADLLLKVTGAKNRIVHLEPRHEVYDAYCNHDLVKRLVGFQDMTNLETMLQQMWAWAKVQPHRKVKEWDTFELEEGVYDFWKKR